MVISSGSSAQFAILPIFENYANISLNWSKFIRTPSRKPLWIRLT